MLQAGRSRNAGGYRFGFQGQEADNKIGGLGSVRDSSAETGNPLKSTNFGNISQTYLSTIQNPRQLQ
jgi:hypothetical protein